MTNDTPLHTPPPARWVRGDWILLGVLIAAKLGVHAYNDPAYSYFRDELYFLICGQNLAFGYVDMAPLAAVYARIAILLGGSLPVVHGLAAVAGAGVVALSMLLARELGGGRYAVGLTGLTVLAAPYFLAISTFLSMNAFEPLYWMGCVYVLMRIVRTGNERLWLAFGLLAGLGILNKHSTLLFGVAVAVGIVLTPLRRSLRGPWIWAGLGIALLLFLPNVVWQALHGFPTLEGLRNVQASGKNVALNPLEYLGRQALLVHPLLLPLWLAGLWHFLLGSGTRQRVLGWTYLALLAIMILLKGKDYYLAPIYPMLLAGGAVALERGLDRLRSEWRRVGLQVAIPVLIVIGAVPVGMTLLPVLPPPAWTPFAQFFRIPTPKSEVSHVSPLPQLLADRTGWEQLTREVAQIYQGLSADEQRRTGILTGNYGQAAAVDWFGPQYGFPRALSGHQNYYLWGHRNFTGDIVIVVGRRKEEVAPFCGSLVEAATHSNPFGIAAENRPILLCRNLKVTLPEVWPRLKFYN